MSLCVSICLCELKIYDLCRQIRYNTIVLLTIISALAYRFSAGNFQLFMIPNKIFN